MKKLWITLAALMLSAPAFANVICAGCEDGNAAGTFLGAFNALRADKGTFQNSDVGSASSFVDLWVFDVSPGALGSISADFTLLTSVSTFAGALYRDAGSVCGESDCASVALGTLVASVDAVASRWEIVEFFTPGRYVIRISGDRNPFNNGAYGGQLGFLAVTVPIREAGTLGLLGLGLVGFALMIRWKKGTLK